MKAVKVTYTTTAAYAEQNQSNIEQVMKDLKVLSKGNIHYDVCLAADGKTFIHTAFFSHDEYQQVLTTLPSFKSFQEQLKASGPEAPPKSESLTFIGSSYSLFS